MNFASDLRDGDTIHVCKGQPDLEGFEIEEAKSLDHSFNPLKRVLTISDAPKPRKAYRRLPRGV